MSLLNRPCIWTLPSGLKTLYVSDLSKTDESQRRAAFQLITDAARRGDNIGADEITSDMFDVILEYPEAIVTVHEPHRQPQLRRLLGLIVVAECRLYRSIKPSTCQLMVVTSSELQGRPACRDLTRLGLALAAESETKFNDCVAEVFVPCLDQFLAMRDVGFVVTACVPTAGLLAGHAGHADSYIMYKELRSTVSDIRSQMSPSNDDEVDDVNLESVSFTLRPLPDYLPCQYVIDGGRTRITVRPLRREDVVKFYEAVSEAADSESGFYMVELPKSLSYFVRTFIGDSYNLVYELARSDSEDLAHGQEKLEEPVVIGYTNFGPSYFSRSRQHPALLGGNIVIRPEFRRRRWVYDLQAICDAISFDCGARCLFQDVAAVNVAAVRSLRRMGACVCGVVPRYVYARSHGFVDGILLYKPLTDSDSFKHNQIITRSKSKI